MSRVQALCLELISIFCLAGCDVDVIPSNVYTGTNVPSGYLFNPQDVYSPMTAYFESINIGTINLPPCIKNLLNCWDMLNPDVVCKYYGDRPKLAKSLLEVNFDTICMDFRFQCREYEGPHPFPENRFYKALNNMPILDICDDAKTLKAREKAVREQDDFYERLEAESIIKYTSMNCQARRNI